PGPRAGPGQVRARVSPHHLEVEAFRNRASGGASHPARAGARQADRKEVGALGGRRASERPAASFFVNHRSLYWVRRRKPAMAINGRRNKPIGPGGSTRRLHQSPLRAAGFGGGETGSTRV